MTGRGHASLLYKYTFENRWQLRVEMKLKNESLFDVSRKVGSQLIHFIEARQCLKKSHEPH